MGNAFSAGWRAILELLGFSKKNATVILLGLDNAGKTTLLHRMTDNEVSSFQPTERAHEESFEVGNVRFRAWDLGGHESIRHTWDDYVPEAHAVVFMVDVADADRFEEAKEELLHLLEGSLDASTPIAVLLNKVDLPYAVDKGAAVSALGLEPFLAASTADAPAHAHAGAAAAAAAGDAPGPQPTPVVEDMEDGVVDGRCVAVFRTSVTRGTGVLEAMQWVAARM